MSDHDGPAVGVEIKFTLSGDQMVEARRAFGVGVGSGRRFLVAFYDVPHTLPLLRSGVVLRTRTKFSGDEGKTTLNLRPAPADRLVGDWAADADVVEGYRVEYDWAGEPVLAASLDTDAARDAIETETAPDAGVLLSPDQRRFFNECGPPDIGGVQMLHRAGPILTFRWDDIAPDDVPGLRAEQWGVDDGALFFEVSLRVDAGEAVPTRVALATELRRRGLVADAGGVTKTEAFLTEQLGG